MAEARRTTLLAATLAALACAWTDTACNRRPVQRGDAHTNGAPPAASFVDEAGRRVVPRAVPSHRVISLAPNVTEWLFAIGAGNQVIGVDNYSDAPAAAVQHIPKLGSNYQPSIEKVLALSPDVVFTSISANRRETVEALDRLGIPVFVTDTRGIADVDRLLANLGRVTGHADDARIQVLRLKTGFDAVRRRVQGRARPRVLVTVWDDPLFVAGRETFTQDLIDVAGGTNVAADAIGFAKYPLERVLRSAPDVLILPTHSTGSRTPEATSYWSRWPQLPAVASKRVHRLDDAIISRPGARLVEGAELLARLFHPNANPP